MRVLRRRLKWFKKWWLSAIRAHQEGQQIRDPFDVGYLGEGSFKYWMQRVERERQRGV